MLNHVPGYIGIDIGGTNLRGALVRANGEILSRFRLKSAISNGADSFLERLTEEVVKLTEDAAAYGLQVQGVGLGIPGLIGNDGTIHSSVNLRPLEGMNLSRLFSNRFQIPVVSANDANLIALGEVWAGAGQGMQSVAVITIGTGLGSGLVLDGKLWTGAGGFAAEFGHLTVEPEGLPCPCGNRGCLEQYVSAAALSRYGGGRTPKELALLAQAGEPVACAAFDAIGYWLGTALAGLLNVLNIEGVIIGGGVSGGFDLFAPMLRKTIQQRAFSQIAEQVLVCQAALGDDAGLVGGALLAAGKKIG
ncbi:glucokinase [Trichlorobacter thiogenes]|uniref:Glucokinase n=1 Tax=Trichlorobacter thiogenes TaxID=115783 RepID=A0A1T4RCX2_9BACT|nr:ROK family protein [Trichlorobacter thiogenes]SKA13666.1 glucokinase [Trichlorobacter thiogenes]